MTISSVGYNQPYVPPKTISFAGNNPVPSVAVSDAQTSEPKKSSFGFGKTLLALGVLATGVYAFLRYRNTQALKPVVNTTENIVNGFKYTMNEVRGMVPNSNGELVEQLVRTVKTKVNSSGQKVMEVITDFKNGEKIVAYFDDVGNVKKYNITRFLEDAKTGKTQILDRATTDIKKYEDGTVILKKLTDLFFKKPIVFLRESLSFTNPTA